MKQSLWVFAIVVGTLLPAVSAAEDFVGRIVGVVDGDTVDLLTDDKTLLRFRLSGIDAPEKRQAFGNVAKHGLSELAFNRRGTIVAHKRDRYGRLVG